jgi:hypothetical protein
MRNLIRSDHYIDLFSLLSFPLLVTFSNIVSHDGKELSSSMDPVTTPPTDGSTAPQQTPPPATPPSDGQSSGNGTNNGTVNAAQGSEQEFLKTLAAQYEQRVRDLMSRGDKNAAERDKAIQGQIALQQELAAHQLAAQTSLSQAAEAAQAALDRSKELEKQNTQLKAESLRANLLLTKPHLADYISLIPLTTDENALKATVENLETIRNNDLQRQRTTLFPGIQQQTPTTYSGLPNQQPNALLQQQQQLQTGMPPTPGLPPTSIPPQAAANPAQMNPMGSMTDVTEAIKQLYANAKASGKREDFEAAHRQAQQLATAAIQQDAATQLQRR